MIFPYNGIFGSKNKWITKACYSMDELGQQCVKWKKSVIKEHIL